MSAYYNEIDPKAAAWLRELIKQGHIAAGEVDERSIEDVTPTDVMGFDQCHFFAGVGAWSYALRRCGWPDDRPVWTGSCPCQPFSAAGKGGGFDDERHVWPAFHWLIKQCQPDVIFGEQVASKDGRAWLDLVSTDLEGEGYAIGAAATVACGFSAPHKRQRTYWVAESESEHCWPGLRDTGPAQQRGHIHSEGSGSSSVAEPGSIGQQRRQGATQRGEHDRPNAGRIEGDNGSFGGSEAGVGGERPAGPTNGHWRSADWLLCRDGKWRPVEPGTFPLAHGAAARMGRVRGYGNAIVAEQAQAFIESYLTNRNR